MPTTCVLYARISQDSERTGLGVARQLEDCHARAASLGWTVVDEFIDNDVSAFSGKPRPRYLAMLDRIDRGGIGGVIAWHTDRLHRSPKELEQYIDLSDLHGVVTQTVQTGKIDLSNPGGRAMARTLGVWARYESEHKSARVRRKMLELAQHGQRPGGPIPYGYRLDEGEPVVVSKQAEEILKAYRSILAGRSIGSIVKDMNGRGIRTGRGGQWTSTSVRNLILRPANAGLVKYQGAVLEGVRSVYPAIVSEDVWRAAVGVISDPSRRSSREDTVRHLLSGLARCGKCGNPLRITARSRAQRGDNGRFYYKCAQTGGGHAHQNAEPLEDYVSRVIVAYLSRPETLQALRKAVAPTVNTEELRDEEAVLLDRRQTAAKLFAEGGLTGAQLKTISSIVQAELDKVRGKLAQAQGSGPAVNMAGPGAAGQWERTDVEGQRAIINALVTIYVDPVGKSAPRVFDSSRVRFSWK